MAEDPSGWKARLLDLNSVDWSKRNREWENICIIANSVVSNRQARQATKAYLKRKMSLTLTEAEERALAKPGEPLDDEARDAQKAASKQERVERSLVKSMGKLGYSEKDARALIVAGQVKP